MCQFSAPHAHRDDPRRADHPRRLVGARDYPLLPGLPAWLRRLRPDIVHLHLPCPLGEWALCLTPGVPRILVSLHNDYVRPDLARRLHYPLHRAILRRAAAIIAGTPDYAQTSPVLMDLQAKVRIIPYRIPLESYAAAALRPPPASPHDARILSAGRLCYYKGIEVLLAAAPAILGQIDIVGDGPWRQRLQAQARRFGLAERVHFAGAVTEDRLIEHLRASYLFVFPSTARSEAFGLAQLKAMASALPVVSSNLPGVSWLNCHGATGLIVPPRAPQALAEAINHLLTDRPLYAQLAHGARRHELGTHGWSHTPVYRQTPAQFRDELLRSVGALQDASGRAVQGHRAAFFFRSPITACGRWRNWPRPASSSTRASFPSITTATACRMPTAFRIAGRLCPCGSFLSPPCRWGSSTSLSAVGSTRAYGPMPGCVGVSSASTSGNSRRSFTSTRGNSTRISRGCAERPPGWLAPLTITA